MKKISVKWNIDGKSVDITNELKDYISKAKQIGISKDDFNSHRYGLEESKPIYCKSIPACYDYIKNLETIDGEELKYKRLGSKIVDGIDYSVDLYEMQKLDGTKYGVIYLSGYGDKTSTKAPRNYKIKEV